MDEYTLTVLPSASSLQFIQANLRDAVGAPLILGNPDGTLPDTETEAETVGELYAAEPLIGKDATESAVYAQADEAGILHLAAHAEYNPVNPLYSTSTIYLAPDDAHDGLLQVHEVYRLNLQQNDMVVLSACETNLGDLSRGDDIVGLTRAFIFAGTPTVVSSLWRVPDESTGLLMERFHTHLDAGMGKAEALRQAQREVREEYPGFRHWAGFVLSGDGGEIAADPLAVADSTAYSPWMGLALVVLIGLAFFWILRRQR